MKNLTALFILFIAAGLLNSTIAQESPVRKLSAKYSNAEGFSTVNISGDMFRMMQSSDKGDKKGDEADKVIENLDGMFIITVDHKKSGKSASDFYNEVMTYFPQGQYREIMSVDEKGKKVLFLASQEGQKVNDLVMIVREDDETVVMNFSGSMMLSDISRITRSIQIK